MQSGNDSHVARTIIARRGLHRRTRSRRGGVPLWATASLVALTLALVGATASVGALFGIYNHYADGYVPIEQKINERTLGLTEVYDRGGPTGGFKLGHLSNPNGQLQEPIPLESISRWMVEATVSTEDNSFWEHPGVNVRGLARAAYENYTG